MISCVRHQYLIIGIYRNVPWIIELAELRTSFAELRYEVSSTRKYLKQIHDLKRPLGFL